MNAKERPHFKPQIPDVLLKSATREARWMYEQLSIQHQQNEWIIDRLAEGEERFDKADQAREELKQEVLSVSARVEIVERLKERLSARWSVVAMVAGAVIWPVVLAIVVRWVEKAWK